MSRFRENLIFIHVRAHKLMKSFCYLLWARKGVLQFHDFTQTTSICCFIVNLTLLC